GREGADGGLGTRVARGPGPQGAARGEGGVPRGGRCGASGGRGYAREEDRGTPGRGRRARASGERAGDAGTRRGGEGRAREGARDGGPCSGAQSLREQADAQSGG